MARNILRIFLRHVNWHLSSLISLAVVLYWPHVSVFNSAICVLLPILCVFEIFARLKTAPRALFRRSLMSSLPPPSFGHSRACIDKLLRLPLPSFQSLLCLLFGHSFSSVCIFLHSASVVHCPEVSRSCSVCAHTLLKHGLYRLQNQDLQE